MYEGYNIIIRMSFPVAEVKFYYDMISMYI